MSKIWESKFQQFVWDINKKFSSFQGNELALFVSNIPKIISFITSEFDCDVQHVRNLKEMLWLWHYIPKFLGITNIDNLELYNTHLLQFEDAIKRFYQVGSKTFLTDHTKGDSETFYLHVLRFYILHISKITLEKHQLGVGVFTMQGYERRNKESKNCFRRFNNRKGNMVTQNMKRLWDVYYYNKNVY